MRIIWIGTALALAISLGACMRDGPRAPRAAVEACGSPKALLAVRRAALLRAADQGAPASLIARLKRDGHASLEDPAVQDYDQDTGVVTCTALLRLQPPDPGAQEISSAVTYDAEPLREGGAYRYRLTEPGQVVQAIASLGPLAPEPAPPPASSAAAEAGAVAANPDTQTLQDAAAAGDTGRSHGPPPAPSVPSPTPATPPH